MTALPFRDQPLDRFLELVASDAPAPGGGAVAAMGSALAAGLVAMAARFSDRQLDDAARVGEEADHLRNLAIALADQDASAYQAVRRAYGIPKDRNDRDDHIRAALVGATEVPLKILRVSTETAVLAARLFEQGNPNLKGDAVVAALLAEAAARGAANLVEINVRLGNLDQCWRDRSTALLARVTEAAHTIDATSAKER